METKFTKGELKIQSCHEGLEIHNGKRAFARVPGFDEQAEANAKLIAACPSMYNALDKICNHFDMDGYGVESWKNLCLEMAEVAKEAIKKATE